MKSTISTWLEVKSPKKYPELKKNVETDVVIVGAGITGILTAYLLAKAGQKVVILEKGEISQRDTAYTTAFITQVIDTSLRNLVKMYEAKKAKLIWESGATAIGELENIINAENIECDFQRCPAYIYSMNNSELRLLEKEESAAKKLGFKFSVKNDGRLRFANNGYWEVPGQAKFHPLKFIYALADRLEKLGVQIFEQSKVVAIVNENGIEAQTEKATVLAKHSIVTGPKPFNKPRVLRFKKGMYMTYVLEAELPKGTLPPAIYLDSKSPYHYFRIDAEKNHDRIIIGGEDHRKDIPVNSEKSIAALETFLKKLLPETRYKITKKWDGPIPESIDGLPFIGAYDKNQFVATTFSGNGMTYSVIAAMLLRDIITKKPNVLKALYDPKRKQKIKHLLFKGNDYIKIFFGGAVKNTLTKTKK